VSVLLNRQDNANSRNVCFEISARTFVIQSNANDLNWTKSDSILTFPIQKMVQIVFPCWIFNGQYDTWITR